MQNVMWALNIAYDRDEGRGFVKRRLIALWMVVFALIGFMLAFGVLVLGPQLSTWIGHASGAETPVKIAWYIAEWPLLIGGLCSSSPRSCTTARTSITALAVPELRRVLLARRLAHRLRGIRLLREPVRLLQQDLGLAGGRRRDADLALADAVALLLGAEINSEAERSRELRQGEPAEVELQAPRRPSPGDRVASRRNSRPVRRWLERSPIRSSPWRSSSPSRRWRSAASSGRRAGTTSACHRSRQLRPWFALCAGGQLIAYVGYAIGLRATAQVDRARRAPVSGCARGRQPRLRPALLGERLGRVLGGLRDPPPGGRGPRRAFRRVLGLSALEYAVLAPAVAFAPCSSTSGRRLGPGQRRRFPWLAVVPGAVAAAWLTSPKRVKRFEAGKDAGSPPPRVRPRESPPWRSSAPSSSGGAIAAGHSSAPPSIGPETYSPSGQLAADIRGPPVPGRPRRRLRDRLGAQPPFAPFRRPGHRRDHVGVRAHLVRRTLRPSPRGRSSRLPAVRFLARAAPDGDRPTVHPRIERQIASSQGR